MTSALMVSLGVVPGARFQQACVAELGLPRVPEKSSPVIPLCAEAGVPVNQKPGKAVRNSSRRVGLPLTAEVWAGSSRP